MRLSDRKPPAAPDRIRIDPWAIAALVFAICVMVFPLEKDTVLTVLRAGKFGLARTVVLGCAFLVLFPALVSLLRIRARPDRWKGLKYLAVTFTIAAIVTMSLLIAIRNAAAQALAGE